MVGCKVAVSYSKCSPMVVNPPPPHPSMEISNDQMTLWNPAPSLEKVMRVCAPTPTHTHVRKHVRMCTETYPHMHTCGSELHVTSTLVSLLHTFA